MSTLVVGEEPVVTQWLAERRALGHDHRDEVWEGVCHVRPDGAAGAPVWDAAEVSGVFGCTMTWLAEQVRWP